MDVNIVFWICYGPKELSKNHLDTTQNTSSESNNYKRGNIGENKKNKIEGTPILKLAMVKR